MKNLIKAFIEHAEASTFVIDGGDLVSLYNVQTAADLASLCVLWSDYKDSLAYCMLDIAESAYAETVKVKVQPVKHRHWGYSDYVIKIKATYPD